MPRLNGRTHLDEATLAHCIDQQTIPLNKIYLAPRVGNKIFRPQKAAYMFQNIPNLSQSQKESLISDFVERSMKSKPIHFTPEVYGAFSLNATRPNVMRDMAIQVDEFLPPLYSVVSPISSADAETNEPRTPDSSVTGLLTDMYPEPDNSEDDAPNEADDASGADTDDEGLDVAVRHPSRPEPTQPGFIVPFPQPFVSPQPPGGRANTHLRFSSPNRRRPRINPFP